MIRRNVSAAIALVGRAFDARTGDGAEGRRTVFETWEDDWRLGYETVNSVARVVPGRNFFWRNDLDRHVLVAYCVTRGGDEVLMAGDACEGPPQYYQAFSLMETGYVLNATLNHGALPAAPPASRPNGPLQTRTSDTYKCIARSAAMNIEQLPER